MSSGEEEDNVEAEPSVASTLTGAGVEKLLEEVRSYFGTRGGDGAYSETQSLSRTVSWFH